MTNSDHKQIAGDVLVIVASVLTALPLFIIAHKELPLLNWPYEADRILLFLIMVALLLLILRVFRWLILTGFFLLLLWLGYGSLTGHYGFMQLYHDYSAMIFAIGNDPHPARLLFSSSRAGFPYEAAIKKAIQPANPGVRRFAVAATNRYFKDAQQKFPQYRNLIQCFAIFKQVNSRWNYVDDPRQQEYFAPAPESAQLLAGDCDDHAILMASAVLAIGGAPRLVLTTGHLYPELCIGNRRDLEQINYLIRKQLFPGESRGQDIHYHEDENGRVWINMDYTARYPGGPFMAEPVLGMLEP